MPSGSIKKVQKRSSNLYSIKYYEIVANRAEKVLIAANIKKCIFWCIAKKILFEWKNKTVFIRIAGVPSVRIESSMSFPDERNRHFLFLSCITETLSE